MIEQPCLHPVLATSVYRESLRGQVAPIITRYMPRCSVPSAWKVEASPVMKVAPPELPVSFLQKPQKQTVYGHGVLLIRLNFIAWQWQEPSNLSLAFWLCPPALVLKFCAFDSPAMAAVLCLFCLPDFSGIKLNRHSSQGYQMGPWQARLRKLARTTE